MALTKIRPALTLLAIAAIALAAAGCSPVIRPAGPATETPRIEEGALIVRDGVRLPLRSWLPDGRPSAALLALHSFGDYSAAFERLGPWFAARGVAVYAYDQRGFGRAPHPGLWAGTETLVGDLQDAIMALRPRIPEDAPLYLLGESMGGAVVMALAGRPGRPDAEGLILAAPAVREAVPFRRFWDILLWTGAHTIPWAGRTVERDDRPRLTETAQERLARDPLVIRHVRLDTYAGLIDLADAASAAAARIDLPTLMLYGTADASVIPESICAAAAKLDDAATTVFYPGRPHLILQSEEDGVLFRDIAAWMAGGEPPSLEPAESAIPGKKACGDLAGLVPPTPTAMLIRRTGAEFPGEA